MAFSYGGQIGSSINVANSTSAITFTVGAGGVPIGALIVIYASKSTSVASITATDTRSNTYTTAQTATEPVDSQTLSLIYTVVTTALTSGNTITLTYGTGFSVKLGQAHYFTATGTIAFGTSASATSTFPHTAKATGALTVASVGELLVAGWDENFAPETWTPGTGYTSLATINDSNGISSGYAEYNLSAGATGSTTPAASVGTGSSSVGIGARFTESGGGGGATSDMPRTRRAHTGLFIPIRLG